MRVGPNMVVTGHPDATGVMPLFGGEAVIEVKTRGPEAFKRWRTLGAERSHPASVAQAAFYTLGTYGELRDAVIATMDTGSRVWDYEVIPAERVGKALERGLRMARRACRSPCPARAGPRRAARPGLLRQGLAVQVLPLPQRLHARRGGG